MDRFETLLKAAQETTVTSEDHAFWIDYRCFYQARRVMQEFGCRFAEAGLIEEPNDVFYLTLDELRETAKETFDADRRVPVSERKARLERFGAGRPPTHHACPPWTPLFATASAVVTDTGGALSHCAGVAREYRIPAVVGTGEATKVIKDGQLLEVDGDAGVVRIIEPA
jgi:hypothetical protein